MLLRIVPSRVALIASNLSFAYPNGPDVLSRVSCSLEQGVITSILGPNGAGKSTLVRILAGVRSPDAGRVTLDASDLSTMKARVRASRLALVAQRSALAFDFDVRRVVELGRHAIGPDRAAVDRAIDAMELRDLDRRPVGSLSVGQQQRVAIARAFAQLDGRSDSVLLADEPTSAMDPAHQRNTLERLRTLADRGAAIGLVVHDTTLAATWSDRVIILNRAGTIAAEGPTDEILTPGILSDVFGIGFASAQVGSLHVLTPDVTPRR